MTRDEQIAALEREWQNNSRWSNINRGYGAADVVRLRGSVPTSGGGGGAVPSAPPPPPDFFVGTV